MEHDLTTGSIGKKLILFSLPMILGNLLQQLYNIADTLIVGRTIGAAALAAVGSAYALMVLLTSIILGLCMGSSVVFAQLYGAKKMKALKTSIYNALVFILIISVFIMLLSYLLLNRMILWLHIPVEAIVDMKNYLLIIFAGILFVAVYNFVAAILRSIGNTMVPLIFLAVSAITNIILDLYFILGLQLQVAGAALATVLSQALSAACITLYFLKKASFLYPGKSDRYYNRELLTLILHNSILTAIQQSIMNLGILMVQGLVNSFGYAASAAFAVVVKIDGFAYMPAQDFGNAFATFVAQNVGAGQWNRIRKGFRQAVMMSVVFCLIASMIVYFFAGELVGLFLKPEEVESIRIGISYLHIEGVFYAGIGILFLLYAYYRGLGRAGMSIILTIFSLGTRVVLAYLLSGIPELGLTGIWWAVPIGWALADAFGIWYLCRLNKQLSAKATFCESNFL